jgi:hypothetical protein
LLDLFDSFRSSCSIPLVLLHAFLMDYFKTRESERDEGWALSVIFRLEFLKAKRRNLKEETHRTSGERERVRETKCSSHVTHSSVSNTQKHEERKFG